MSYSTILFISALLYVLRFLLGLRRWRRQTTSGSFRQRIRSSLRNIPRIAIIAGLIVLEHMLYRYTSGFALGLELTVLRVNFCKIWLMIGDAPIYVLDILATKCGGSAWVWIVDRGSHCHVIRPVFWSIGFNSSIYHGHSYQCNPRHNHPSSCVHPQRFVALLLSLPTLLCTVLCEIADIDAHTHLLDFVCHYE